MSDAKLMRAEKLRELLLEEKRKLWQEFHSRLFEEQGRLHEQFDNPGDVGDQSMLDVLADTGLAVADILREKLTRIEMAEQQLAQGNFGMCEDCGAEIDVDRLRAVPFATRCVSCQKLSEGPPSTSGKTL
jgi:DnaK suppressor protein